jgi:hypothetical protein
MNGPLAMILVVLIIVMGIGAAWAITAQGAATTPIQDSFGNTATANVINQTNQSAGLAVATMPVVYIAFIIVVCVVLVVAFVWLWNTGKNKKGKY